MNHSTPNFDPLQPSPNRKTWILAAGFVLLLLGNVYLLTRVNRLQVRANTLQTTLSTELAQLHESMSVRSVQAQHELDGVRQEVQDALQEAAKRATSEARKETGWLARNVSKSQREQQEQILGQISTVEGSTSEAHQKIAGVSNDLETVKTGLTETKFQIEETESALDSTVAHLDTMDGLIARNESEISDLRKRGERQHYAFRLTKSKFMQKIGDIQVRLRNTDAKHNKYSLEVLADDRKVVKKERQVNEPIQFYVTGSAFPYEIVVTSVTKDRVTGYLATAAVKTSRG